MRVQLAASAQLVVAAPPSQQTSKPHCAARPWSVGRAPLSSLHAAELHPAELKVEGSRICALVLPVPPALVLCRVVSVSQKLLVTEPKDSPASPPVPLGPDTAPVAKLLLTVLEPMWPTRPPLTSCVLETLPVA